MGRAGRVSCIFTPFVLSIASLICIILVMTGGLSKSSSTLSQLYFFRTDLSGLYNTALSPGSTTKEAALSNALQQIKTAGTVKRFYDIYMWNFCAGNTVVPNEFSVCGKAKADWSFDLIEVWGLNGTGMEYAFPKELTDAVKVYDAVSKWNYYAYLFAAIATVLEVLVGISAVFSRWGSFATTIFSGIAATLTVAAAITSIALFASFVGTFNHVFRPYHITATLGHNVYVASWLGALFAVGASIFWFFSIFCCSGRSPYHKNAERKSLRGSGRGRTMVQNTAPYTYERVGSPFGAQAGHPSHQQAYHEQSHGLLNVQRPEASSAYEPFRHHGP